MKTVKLINSDDIITLHLLADLNSRILDYGLTKDNIEDLEMLQVKLIELLIKLGK